MKTLFVKPQWILLRLLIFISLTSNICTRSLRKATSEKDKNLNKWVEEHNECRSLLTGALHATIRQLTSSHALWHVYHFVRARQTLIFVLRWQKGRKIWVTLKAGSSPGRRWLSFSLKDCWLVMGAAIKVTSGFRSLEQTSVNGVGNYVWQCGSTPLQRLCIPAIREGKWRYASGETVSAGRDGTVSVTSLLMTTLAGMYGNNCSAQSPHYRGVWRVYITIGIGLRRYAENVMWPFAST